MATNREALRAAVLKRRPDPSPEWVNREMMAALEARYRKLRATHPALDQKAAQKLLDEWLAAPSGEGPPAMADQPGPGGYLGAE